MVRYFFSIALFLVGIYSAFAQENIRVSEEIFITGELAKPLVISLETLSKMKAVDVPDLVITNHLGEPRGTAKELKGVLVTDLLQELEFTVESPRYLSEFFFTFIATDDYKVVFSWNELFNSPTGEHVFFITEKEGKSLADMDDRILMICNSDFKTGRRHVKSLDRIIVNRVK